MKVSLPRVAFYMRISTDEQHQKYSLAAQREQIRHYCERHFPEGWRMAKVYRDTASGTRMDRPGLRRMLRDAERRAFDAVVVSRIDRLSRNLRQFVTILEQLTDFGVDLKSVTESFDVSDTAGRMMAEMLGTFAEFESAVNASRAATNSKRRAMRGGYVGSRPPYGYRLIRGKGLVVCREEAETVKRIFQLYVREKLGYARIAKELYAEGLHRRCDKPWTTCAIRQVIVNPVCAGKVRCQGVHDGNHEPIISEELFGEAQRICRGRAGKRAPNRSSTGKSGLLAGILRCGLCGSPMYAATGECRVKAGRSRRAYGCRRRDILGACEQKHVTAFYIDEAVVAEVMEIVRDEELLQKVWRAASGLIRKGGIGPKNELARIGLAKEKAKKAMDGYHAAFERGLAGREHCSELVEEMRGRLDEMTEREDALRSLLDRLRSSSLSLRALGEYEEQLEEDLAGDEFLTKRRRLAEVLERISLHGTRSMELRCRLPVRIVVPRLLPGLSGEDAAPGSSPSLPEVRFSMKYETHAGEGALAQDVVVRVGSGDETETGACTVRRTLDRDQPLLVFLQQWHVRLQRVHSSRRA